MMSWLADLARNVADTPTMDELDRLREPTAPEGAVGTHPILGPTGEEEELQDHRTLRGKESGLAAFFKKEGVAPQFPSIRDVWQPGRGVEGRAATASPPPGYERPSFLSDVGYPDLEWAFEEAGIDPEGLAGTGSRAGAAGVAKPPPFRYDWTRPPTPDMQRAQPFEFDRTDPMGAEVREARPRPETYDRDTQRYKKLLGEQEG